MADSEGSYSRRKTTSSGGGNVGSKAASSSASKASKASNPAPASTPAPNPVNNQQEETFANDSGNHYDSGSSSSSGTSWLGTPTTTQGSGTKQASGAVSNPVNNSSDSIKSGLQSSDNGNSIKSGLQSSSTAQAQEEQKKAQEAQAAALAKQQAEAAAKKKAEEEAARQAEIKRQQEEAARQAELQRQEQLRQRQLEEARLAEIARQEAIRAQQASTTAMNQQAVEEVSQRASAPEETVNDAVADADANIAVIQEQLNVARSNGSTDDILRLTEDLLRAQEMRQYLESQANEVASARINTTSTANPIAVTPQAVSNTNTQPTTVGTANVLANNIANTLLQSNNSRNNAFIRNAGRTVQEDEDEFWTGGNPLREAIDRVNSGNLRATDQTYGRPVNRGDSQNTTVYDVNPTLQYASDNPNNNGAISRDQFLEATSNLFNPIANFGVSSAEASYPYMPTGPRFGGTESSTAVEPQEGSNTPAASEPQYTYDDYYNMIYQNARQDGATAREAAIIADEGAKQWLDYDASVTPKTFKNVISGLATSGATFADARTDVTGRALGTAGRMLRDVVTGIIDSDSRRKYGTDFKEDLPYTPADTNILNLPYGSQAGIDLAIQDANNERTIEQALDAGTPLAEVTRMNGYERAERQPQPQPRTTTRTPRTPAPATTTQSGASNPINTRPYTGTQQVNQATNDLALEASIRRGDITYEQVYDDYVNQNAEPLAQRYIESGRYATEAEARQAAEDTARRQAYNKIYDLGFRSDSSDADIAKYSIPSLIDNLDAIEKTTGNNYYTNDASFGERLFNMAAGGTDRSYEQDRLFYDLTSELAGNAYANQKRGTNYNTTPDILDASDVSNPLNLNGALQAALSGALSPDQILHFYDANYSDINVPESTQKLLASDSTHALQEMDLKKGKNQSRLEKVHASKGEFNKGMQDFLNANPALKLLRNEGVLNVSDIANNFFKARIDEEGNTTNPFAGSGETTGKTLYLDPSHGQGGTVVKAPYRKGGYSEAELMAMGNMPYKDRNGYNAYEGYYRAPDGNWYPVDQVKANYYNDNYHSYRGWDEGMRDYYNTFGTFDGYTPTWRSTGQSGSSGGKSYSNSYSNNYSGGNYSGGSSGNKSSNYSYTRSVSTPSLSANYQPYQYSSSSSTPQYATQQRSSVSPTTTSQRSNRIYNIMKNWSF